MCRRACWLLVAAWLWPSSALAQGRLEQVRQDVSAPSSPEKEDRRKDPAYGPTGGDAGGEGGLGALVVAAALAPFYVPCALCGDQWKVDGYFPAYPYADVPGYVWLAGGDDPRPEGLRAWAGRVSVEDGNDFRGLNRLGGEVLLDTTYRVSLRTSWHYYAERMACGCWDDLLLGDTDVIVRFAQHERVQMYAGAGFRVLAEPGRSRWGFNFTYGGDFFPVEPLVLSAVLDAGTLGSAGVFHARGTAGVLKGRWEFYAGYDFLRVGSVNLQGPLAGVRLWF